MPPVLLVIAGPNGSGKSSIYSLISKRYPPFSEIAFINPDEIAKNIHGKYLQNEDIDSNRIMMQAGRVAARIRKHYINEKQSFGFETTLSGSSEKRVIEAAFEKGYSIYIFFIGLEDPALNVMRVQSRVRNGGHFIPTDVILRRYEKSLTNVLDVIKYTKSFYLVDNSSDRFKLIASMRLKKTQMNQSYCSPENIPKWANDIIEKLLQL